MHPAALAIWLDAGTAAERAAVTQALLYSLLPSVNKKQGAALSAWSALQGVRDGKQELARQFNAGYRQGCQQWQNEAQQLNRQLAEREQALQQQQRENMQLQQQLQDLQHSIETEQHLQRSQQREINQLRALTEKAALAAEVFTALRLMKQKSKNQPLHFAELTEMPLLLSLLRQHSELAQICRDIPAG
ncbi:MAG: hypothetical protein R3241_00215 [Rheinheimera sp.]|nr:hypothetical protein [Rheinheimera sp.]